MILLQIEEVQTEEVQTVEGSPGLENKESTLQAGFLVVILVEDKMTGLPFGQGLLLLDLGAWFIVVVFKASTSPITAFTV